jgi:HEAT repeat protein
MRSCSAILSATVMLLSSAVVTATAPDDARVQALLLPAANVEALRSLGPAVLPAMARIYERSSADERAVVASAFYALGWKSPEAKRVLLQDLHTSHQNLRLQVQWALGRVSGDLDVVDALLDNMRNDGNPLFRDKAACALANDQIHLNEQQKVHLYERLIQALSDPKPQVRSIAIQALQIHTGQTKGFQPLAAPDQRDRQVRAWQAWLAEYRSNL